MFDVTLNGEHTVVENLDIYNKVGRGVAHDEIVPFSVRNGKLKVNGETSKINGKVSVEFIKVYYYSLPIYHTIWIYQKFRTNFKYLLVSFRSSITTIIILTAWRKVNWYQTWAAVHCSLIFQEFAAKFDIYILFNRENMTTPKSMQYMLWKAQLKVIHFNI